MGEATPQSAPGAFVPMLGVGLGAMPGGVGNGPVVATSRGSAVPQLHNAIVERLRARIELCRRHHSTCENRYQRGQAESSDREHESTLHLLNIVHQGPGNRKAKGSRGGSNQQPPEYSRSNGEQKGSEGEQKLSTRIALQGSLRRKIEGHAPGHIPKQNGLSCGFSGSDFKRVRVDTGGLGHGPCNHNLTQSHSLQGSSSMGMQRKNYMMPHGVGSDIFNMTLKEMKKEPMEVQSCGQHNTEMIFDFKDEGGGQIDPDLQDLFDELTKTVPPLNDLEFEKILKQDDTFGLDLGRPNSAGAAASLCSPMEKPIKTEHSPDFGQVHGGSPQLRPASAGPSFTLTSTSSTTTSQKANTQAGHPRAMPCWPEISHAEQLKQMAANQQQPSSLLHHHHQPPPVGLTSWAPAMSTHSSTSTFPQDKVSSSAPLSQQRISAQSKGINNCLFKSNGHSGSHHLDMKVLSTKPTLHFSPKAPHSASQPMPIMASSVNKSSAQQQQSPSTGQNQPHSALHFQNQQISTSGALCLQPKSVPAGLPFKLSQQRQGVPPGPRLPTNGSLGVMSGQSQPRPPAPNSQQKGPAKTQSMQRQLNQQQHTINNSDKDNAHDQFSRHLTRPPPDYKQSRSMVGLQQGNIFTGQNSSQSSSNGPENDLQSMSCHLPSGSGSKISPSPSDRRFGIGADCHPSPCITQFQQHNTQNRIGLNQNKPKFLGPNTQGGSFGMNNVAGVQHPRTTADLHSSGVPGQGLGGLMTNVNMGWGAANKQVTTGLGVRRLPNPLQSQGAQLDMPNHPYQQRHIGPPNQVAPDIGMLPLNPSIRDTGPRPSQPMMGSPSAVGNLNQASPEQRVPAGSFAEPSPSSSSYQNNRANRLTFDFLPEGDNTVPGINTDSDFIDSLLKSGSGNDDWMKDINLDEILGSHS
ncbi:mastermind-like protein 2 [Seriola lalandi dorsalis]|uniref:mastermind-like protein 2 n=1 Tax=Seriola lalandi dorsalis TaxID=1841481 RepID=UPI000C6FA80D|nr:mastermind-like protein 2 [Seriola lalandi dorsalis]XP_056230579.1 mastermind-like protein 2 [Seriola aureovittata]